MVNKCWYLFRKVMKTVLFCWKITSFIKFPNLKGCSGSGNDVINFRLLHIVYNSFPNKTIKLHSCTLFQTRVMPYNTGCGVKKSMDPSSRTRAWMPSVLILRGLWLLQNEYWQGSPVWRWLKWKCCTTVDSKPRHSQGSTFCTGPVPCRISLGKIVSHISINKATKHLHPCLCGATH